MNASALSSTIVFCIIVWFVAWKVIFGPLEPLILLPPASMPGIHCSKDRVKKQKD